MMMQWWKKSLYILALVSLLTLVACGGANQTGGGSSDSQQSSGQQQSEQTQSTDSSGETLTLKLGHQAPETSNYQTLSVKFKELVEQKTQGKVKIEIYPFRQLGGDRELMEAMQFGNLDLGAITSAPVSNFAPQFTVMDLPYVFDDWDHLLTFVSSDTAKELLKETEAKGLKSLALMPRGFRHVTSAKQPITKPEDLKGMKIRVIESPVYIDTFTALGANPQAMAWADAYTAMQQGAIEGQENTLDIIFDERVDEVQKYVSKTGHMAAFITLMASKTNFDKWPADVQKAIEEAAMEAALAIGEGNRTREKEYQKKLEEKGMTFNELDREVFRGMVKGVYDSFTQKNGDKYLKAIEALRK